jgi:hypothetical protein
MLRRKMPPILKKMPPITVTQKKIDENYSILIVNCACGKQHCIQATSNKELFVECYNDNEYNPCWLWNGSLDKPTIYPCIHDDRGHCFITQGTFSSPMYSNDKAEQLQKITDKALKEKMALIWLVYESHPQYIPTIHS